GACVRSGRPLGMKLAPPRPAPERMSRTGMSAMRRSAPTGGRPAGVVMSSVTGHLLETALPSRRSIALARNVFGPLAILADATVIMAVAILTGMAYHTVIYGESGDIVNFLEAGALAAAAFVLPNIPRG